MSTANTVYGAEKKYIHATVKFLQGNLKVRNYVKNYVYNISKWMLKKDNITVRLRTRPLRALVNW
jgi:hypothetical protein